MSAPQLDQPVVEFTDHPGCYVGPDLGIHVVNMCATGARHGQPGSGETGGAWPAAAPSAASMVAVELPGERELLQRQARGLIGGQRERRGELASSTGP